MYYIIDSEEGLFLEVCCPECDGERIDIEERTEDDIDYYCLDCDECFSSADVENCADEEDWKVLDDEAKEYVLGEL